MPLWAVAQKYLICPTVGGRGTNYCDLSIGTKTLKNTQNYKKRNLTMKRPPKTRFLKGGVGEQWLH